MKKINDRFPFLFRIVLAILLGFVAIILSGMIYNTLPIRSYFPFVGITLLLAVTWLLYKTDKERISSLGVKLNPKNLGYLFFGLVIGIIAFFCVSWLQTVYTGEAWHISESVDVNAITKSFYFILPSVMVEELMFRGYLFTKTISRYGVVTANIIFSIAFMLVHVLDRHVLQNPGQLIMLAVCIPIGHLWFATALLRSKTILFPIGLHWGNNWAVAHLFGATANKQSIFYNTEQKIYTTWSSFVIMLLIYNIFFLLVTLITWKAKWPRFATTPS